MTDTSIATPDTIRLLIDRMRLEAPAWHRFAICDDPELFFPPSEGANARGSEGARQLCARCPVRDRCAWQAIEDHEWGFWGGTSPRLRARIRSHPLTLELYRLAAADEAAKPLRKIPPKRPSMPSHRKKKAA